MHMQPTLITIIITLATLVYNDTTSYINIVTDELITDSVSFIKRLHSNIVFAELIPVLFTICSPNNHNDIYTE